MTRWRSVLPGLFLASLVACGGATTSSNQSLADPTATPQAAVVPPATARPSGAPAAAVPSTAPTSAAVPATATRAATQPPAPATAISVATQPPAPATATAVAPRPSVPPTATAAAARPSAPPTANVVPQPNGTVPPGWKVYRGPAAIPIVFAYPPDWTIDTSLFPEQTVIFVIGPNGGEENEIIEISWGMQQTEANIDVLRDDFFFRKTDFCDKTGIEYTEHRQISNATFALVGAACNDSNTLSFLLAASGLKSSDEWDIVMRTPYERRDARLNEVFNPLLASLNIYALIAP